MSATGHSGYRLLAESWNRHLERLKNLPGTQILSLSTWTASDASIIVCWSTVRHTFKNNRWSQSVRQECSHWPLWEELLSQPELHHRCPPSLDLNCESLLTSPYLLSSAAEKFNLRSTEELYKGIHLHSCSLKKLFFQLNWIKPSALSKAGFYFWSSYFPRSMIHDTCVCPSCAFFFFFP